MLFGPRPALRACEGDRVKVVVDPPTNQSIPFLTNAVAIMLQNFCIQVPPAEGQK